MCRSLGLGSVVLASLLAGCAVSPPAEPGIDASTPSSRVDAARPDAFRSSPIDAGRDAWSGACGVTCTTDSHCTAGCGDVVGGGIRCCDPATSHCFVSHTAVCPTPGAGSYGNDSGLFVRPDTGVDSTVDAACPASSHATTEFAVTALGMPGMTLTLVSGWSGPIASVTLDATGSAVFTAPGVSIGLYYSNLTLVDGVGLPVTFRLSNGVVMTDVIPACIAPDPGTVQPLDRVEVVLQRDVANGLCAGSVLSVAVDCVSVTGEYTPAKFDDMPCGPFR